MSVIDEGTVAAHLRWAHGHAIEAGVPGRVVLSERQPAESAASYISGSWPLTDLQSAGEAALRCSRDRHRNLYSRVHLIDRTIRPNERGRSVDTRWVTHVAADVDIAGPGHSPPDGKKLPPDLDTAVELVDASLPPSMIVSSGGGLYPIWRLSEVVEVHDDDDRRQVRDIGRRIDLALGSHGWHVDATCMDLARVIRPPGVTNHKPGRDPRPVIVLRGYGFGAGDYSLDQLDRLLPALPTPEPVRARPPGEHHVAGAVPAWELFAERYTVEDVLAADDRHRWERVADEGGMAAWRRADSESGSYSIKLSDDGVIIVWSSVIAAELDIQPGSGLDLWGFACRLAGRDPVASARGVRT